MSRKRSFEERFAGLEGCVGEGPGQIGVQAVGFGSLRRSWRAPQLIPQS